MWVGLKEMTLSSSWKAVRNVFWEKGGLEARSGGLAWGPETGPGGRTSPGPWAPEPEPGSALRCAFLET